MNGLDLKKIDWAMATTILILLSISVAFIYSAQFQSAGSVESTWQRQIFFGLFGLGLYTLTTGSITGFLLNGRDGCTQ